MTNTRREVLKLQAAAVAAAAAGIGPAAAQPLSGGIGSLQIAWSKPPCRFCGTGRGVMVGVRDGKVVATHGDAKAEVHRGLNCVTGYLPSKILYGADRPTRRLLRQRTGIHDKDGDSEEERWD